MLKDKIANSLNEIETKKKWMNDRIWGEKKWLQGNGRKRQKDSKVSKEKCNQVKS